MSTYSLVNLLLLFWTRLNLLAALDLLHLIAGCVCCLPGASLVNIIFLPGAGLGLLAGTVVFFPKAGLLAGGDLLIRPGTAVILLLGSGLVHLLFLHWQ